MSTTTPGASSPTRKPARNTATHSCGPCFPSPSRSSWCRRCALAWAWSRAKASAISSARNSACASHLSSWCFWSWSTTPTWSPSSSASPARCAFSTSPSSSPSLFAPSWSGIWWCAAPTKALKKYSSSPLWSISATSSPVSFRSRTGTMRSGPPSSCLPDRYGAIRPICTWPSASLAPPSPRGCSSISSPRSWKREFA